MEFPHINPVAFEVGFIVIRWYALAYLAGFLLGWRYALMLAYRDDSAQKKGQGQGREMRPDRTDIDDFLVWAIPAVILGGRLGYVLFYNFPYYSTHPAEIFQVWKGGMSFHGGVIGVTIAMLIYAARHKIPVFQLSDIISAVAPIGLFFGRLANFINGELYGRATTVPWGMVFPGGGPEPRHPSQLYEAVLEGALLFVLLQIMIKYKIHHKVPGMITGAFLLLYGAFRFLIEYVREPDVHLGLLFHYVSMGQLLCLPMICLGAGIMLYARQQRG
ncbi:MAG: prolipoprotein diacylglyceryl transferase [Rhodospirillales bacterium]|nr:prolipoprotein diacylglyceryl transferase [Rhodospirillales bacterium]MCB9973570.1 prolipoprotein diacylglyceryl transferase [Rhodospirillales bacterium]MCB9979626.1 prolipoprotein diacylglyceryl transferase [Rhodospirillales bacterium]